MANQEQFYPADGSLDDLSTTCQGDEDVFRAKLTKLERIDAADGTKNNKATYQRIPFDQEYVKKELFFFDVASTTPQPPETDVVFESADVYLNDNRAKVAVYRTK